MQNCEMERMLDQAVEMTWQVWIEVGLSIESWNALSGQEMWGCLWTALLRSSAPEALVLLQWFWRTPSSVRAAFVARWNAGKYRKGNDAGSLLKLPV